jgi:hypothetical protein
MTETTLLLPNKFDSFITSYFANPLKGVIKNKSIFIVAPGLECPIMFLKKPKNLTKKEWELVQECTHFTFNLEKFKQEIKNLNSLEDVQKKIRE